MSGTNIFYNGVRMQDCELTGWDQSVDTMDSDVGVRFTRIRFTASSSLVRLQNAFSDNDWRDRGKANSPHILSSGFAPLAGGNDYGLLSDLMQRVSHDLSQPRKDFLLWIDSTCEPATVDESPNVPQNNQGRTKVSRVIVAATGIIPVEATEKLNVGTGDNEYSESPTETQILRRHVIDANSGPKVSNVKIEQVAGGAFCKVTATFEICRVLYQVDAPDNIPDEVVEYDAQKAKGVIYNRWSIVDGMDSEGKVSHDISGKMCVKDHRYKANACRLFAFPFAFPYGRMVDRNYTVSEDGLTLEYRFKFQHAGAAPPAYVRDYKATYVEETGPGLGSKGIQRGSMQIKVKGWYHRSTNNPATAMTEKVQKAMLLRGAFTLLYARIRGIDMLWDPLPGQIPKRVQMLTTTVSEQVGKPELDLNVTVQYTQQERGEFGLRLSNMGEPIPLPGYDPRWWPVDNEWGRMMSEDVANPFFRSAAVPYAAEGMPAHSDYCDIYIQPPYSQRHTLPRLTGQTRHEASTDGGANDWEWARLDGTPIDSGTTATIASGSNTSPINQLALTAYVSKDLKGEDYQASLPQRVNEEYTGVSEGQRNGYTYIQWDSELLTDSEDGTIMVPLSKARKRPAFPGLTTGAPSGVQSAVKLKLHAGVAKRVYSVTTTRQGDYPDLPQPAPAITRTKSTTNSEGATITEIVNREHRLKTETIKDGCELMPDGVTKLYTVHMRWTYGLENSLFTSHFAEGSGTSSDPDRTSYDDSLPSIRSPILKSTFAEDSLSSTAPKLKSDMIQG